MNKLDIKQITQNEGNKQDKNIKAAKRYINKSNQRQGKKMGL